MVYSHTISGLFWFDLPLGLLLTILYLTCIEEKLISALPQCLYRNYDGRSRDLYRSVWSFECIAVICYSVLLGAVSHLLWDAFTHPYGYFVSQIPWLDNSIAVESFNLKYYKLLQHTSTIAGLVFIAVSVASYPKVNSKVDKSFRINFWATVTVVVVFIVIIKILWTFNRLVFGYLVVTTISAFFIGIFLAAVTKEVKYRKPKTLLNPQLIGGQFVLSRAEYVTGIVLDKNLDWAVDDNQTVFEVYDDIEGAIKAAKSIVCDRSDIECYVHDSHERLVYFTSKDECKDLR